MILCDGIGGGRLDSVGSDRSSIAVAWVPDLPAGPNRFPFSVGPPLTFPTNQRLVCRVRVCACVKGRDLPTSAVSCVHFQNLQIGRLVAQL